VSHLHTREGIARDLRALGLTTGDIVTVHASLRATSEVAGGPGSTIITPRDSSPGEGTSTTSSPRSPRNFAFGHGSALERFTQLDGRILLLGARELEPCAAAVMQHVAGGTAD
jgi:aminoglycoside N3'-acetyltransferase